MTMTNWDPFREMTTLRDAMDQLFEQSFVRPRRRGGDGSRRTLYLPIDAYTTEDEIVVQTMLPGVYPENVDITIEDNTLSISGEIPAPSDEVNWVIQESAYGPFRRTLNLNVPVNADAAEANFENGLLTLHLPKAEEAKPKRIEVHNK